MNSEQNQDYSLPNKKRSLQEKASLIFLFSVLSMGIIWVEVCLISAHGLQHSTSLWKRQWFAVGWIDPHSKYCTKVDASENANPVWRTKFIIPVDGSAPYFQDLELNVEVYSLDPIFLTEKLHGTASVVLKEFLDKQVKNSEVSKPRHEKVGRYQLRKNKSSKPRGFIDISIRVYEEKKEPDSHSGSKRGIVLSDRGNDTHFNTKGGLGQANPQKQPQVSFHQEENHVEINTPEYHAVPFPTTNYLDPYEGGPSYHASEGLSYQPPRTITPPPPPPPAHAGSIPTFLPRNDCLLPPSYTDMLPPTAVSSQKGPPGFAMGIGAGALAAGALIFGDDFMSGFDVPPGIGDACLYEDIDPPF